MCVYDYLPCRCGSYCCRRDFQHFRYRYCCCLCEGYSRLKLPMQCCCRRCFDRAHSLRQPCCCCQFIGIERTSTDGRVGVATGVAEKRRRPVGGVVAGGGVAIERLRTVGRIAEAGCVAEKRIKTGCRVIAYKRL